MKNQTKEVLLNIAVAAAVTLAFGYVGSATAQTAAQAIGQSASDSGAMAQTGAITFEAANPHKRSSVDTTPTMIAPPSMFGGANNCGQSDTLTGVVTGFGIGGSKASEGQGCTAREDTSIAYKLGYKDVADMRFFCFGTDANRMAWEATGRTCPSSATAKGLDTKMARVTSQSNFTGNGN